VTPASSTLTLLPAIPITSFNYTVCGYFVLDCIAQPSPGEKVDAVSEWPMFRFTYRNLRDHEALVGNFTVDVSGTGHAGIRWFELRKVAAGNWTLFQEGTQAPDLASRWMGSVAMDANGNIALGFSIAGSALNPSLRYATRLAGDAPGTLDAEETLALGGGVQTDGVNRWGDYSAMSVDPSDDCTFWYTGEYYSVTSARGWRTRIGAFKIPSCRATRFDDVGTFNFAYLYVEALAAEGLVGGCDASPPLYCPDFGVGRAAMAVLLVRGIHGAGFVPPVPTGIFADVPPGNPGAGFIEQLYYDGVTGGCDVNPLRYCPFGIVTRDQMAIFLLRARHGGSYTPPPATGTVFADVPASNPYAPWIEQLAAEGITGGCGGGNYCPTQIVTRAQMAIFVVRTFDIPL
jgi:S-layer family protein